MSSSDVSDRIRSYEIGPFGELRFEGAGLEPVTINYERLDDKAQPAHASICGYNLRMATQYTYPSHFRSTLFTVTGCRVTLGGCINAYVQDYPASQLSDSMFVSIANIHAHLRNLRERFASDTTSHQPGPVVAVVGPSSSGKSTVALTLANLAAADAAAAVGTYAAPCNPIYVDLDVTAGRLGCPGAVGCVPLHAPVAPPFLFLSSARAASGAAAPMVRFYGSAAVAPPPPPAAAPPGSRESALCNDPAAAVARLLRLADTVADDAARLTAQPHVAVAAADPSAPAAAARAHARTRGGLIVDTPPSDALGASGTAALLRSFDPDVVVVVNDARTFHALRAGTLPAVPVGPDTPFLVRRAAPAHVERLAAADDAALTAAAAAASAAAAGAAAQMYVTVARGGDAAGGGAGGSAASVPAYDPNEPPTLRAAAVGGAYGAVRGVAVGAGWSAFVSLPSSVVGASGASGAAVTAAARTRARAPIGAGAARSGAQLAGSCGDTLGDQEGCDDYGDVSPPPAGAAASAGAAGRDVVLPPTPDSPAIPPAQPMVFAGDVVGALLEDRLCGGGGDGDDAGGEDPLSARLRAASASGAHTHAAYAIGMGGGAGRDRIAMSGGLPVAVVGGRGVPWLRRHTVVSLLRNTGAVGYTTAHATAVAAAAETTYFEGFPLSRAAYVADVVAGDPAAALAAASAAPMSREIIGRRVRASVVELDVSKCLLWQVVPPTAADAAGGRVASGFRSVQLPPIKWSATSGVEPGVLLGPGGTTRPLRHQIAAVTHHSPFTDPTYRSVAGFVVLVEVKYTDPPPAARGGRGNAQAADVYLFPKRLHVQTAVDWRALHKDGRVVFIVGSVPALAMA